MTDTMKKHMITLSDFIAKYTGQQIPFTNCETGQCMALMHAYIAEVFGLTDPTILATPSAYQVYSNFTQLTGNQYFTPVANTPNGIPNPGDIGVIGANEQGAGVDGHVFVIISATINEVIGFSQNWPTGTAAEQRTFSYIGLNWLTPRPQGTFVDTATFEQLVNKASAFDNFVTAGYSSVDAINQKLKSFTDQITTLQKQVGDLTTQNESLALEVKQNKDQMAKLADITQQQATSDSEAINEGLTASQQVKVLTTDLTTVASELNTTYPPVKNLTGAITTLQNQLKAAQIALTQKANENAALIQSQQQAQAVVNASKGFFSKIVGFFWVSKP